jgi:hypothetical protein
MLLRPDLLAAIGAAALLASGAAAQSCYPVAVLLAVTDAAGRRIAPPPPDSIRTFHRHHRSVEPRVVSRPYHPAPPGDDTGLIQWSISGCRLQLDSVTVRGGGAATTLLFGMELDSERRRGPSVFLFEAPPLEGGRFRLRWDPLEPADRRWEDPGITRGRWTRIEGGPSPETRPGG